MKIRLYKDNPIFFQSMQRLRSVISQPISIKYKMVHDLNQAVFRI